MSERVLGLIPARGGSKGVHRKNVREVAGDPLVAYSIAAGRGADGVDRVVVSSDDAEIREVARDHGADVPFGRPADLATDEAPTAPVVVHALEWFEREESVTYDTVVLLQPTSPLRTAIHVDEALERYRETGADSLLSVYRDHAFRWRRGEDGAERVNDAGRKRRQDMESEFVENGAIYIVDAARFRDETDFSLGRTVLYEMDETASVDIDTLADLELAACLLEGDRP